ncbi:MAG TPA: DNA translocase FtsK 4TM domain-containing protein, partial [Prolixibacteraceae bacterium]|nr:DNA translocase FtsK 4TM domain-containing protein [Prolixibacteraceae bacterium]
MAVKKQQNTKKKASQKPTNTSKPKVNSGKKLQYRLVFGFALLAISIYLFFAFSSFLVNAEADQSKFSLNWWKFVSDPNIKVENITGKTGAWIADVFINRWFGIPSFLLLYLSVLYGFKLLNRPIKNLYSKTLKSLLLIIWLSVTLGYIFGNVYEKVHIYPGGNYGFHISLWLNSFIGKVGTFFILLLALLAYLVFAIEGFVQLFVKSDKPKTKQNPEGSLIDDSNSSDALSENPNNEPTKVILEESDDQLPDDLEEEFEIERDERSTKQTTEQNETVNTSIDGLTETQVETKTIAPENETDDVEMTVEKKEELIGEYENQPMEDYDPTLDLSHYEYPPIDLLEDYSHLKNEVSDEELKENRNKIVETLRNFKIEITKIKATIGPTVTLYEIVPAQGIRISKIKNLEDDIALSLSALGIRIIAPIPGRGTIGIEVPNRNPQVVSMRSIVASKKFQETTAELPVVMGRTISNETFLFDLTKMPHM